MAAAKLKDFKTGDLVFAKVRGYPPWPARVDQRVLPAGGRVPKNKIPVFFFGTHEAGYLLPKDVFHYAEFKDQYAIERKHKKFKEGLHEIEHTPHLRLKRKQGEKVNSSDSDFKVGESSSEEEEDEEDEDEERDGGKAGSPLKKIKLESGIEKAFCKKIIGAKALEKSDDSPIDAKSSTTSRKRSPVKSSVNAAVVEKPNRKPLSAVMKLKTRQKRQLESVTKAIAKRGTGPSATNPGESSDKTTEDQRPSSPIKLEDSTNPEEKSEDKPQPPVDPKPKPRQNRRATVVLPRLSARYLPPISEIPQTNEGIFRRRRRMGFRLQPLSVALTDVCLTAALTNAGADVNLTPKVKLEVDQPNGEVAETKVAEDPVDGEKIEEDQRGQSTPTLTSQTNADDGGECEPVVTRKRGRGLVTKKNQETTESEVSAIKVELNLDEVKTTRSGRVIRSTAKAAQNAGNKQQQQLESSSSQNLAAPALLQPTSELTNDVTSNNNNNNNNPLPPLVQVKSESIESSKDGTHSGGQTGKFLTESNKKPPVKKDATCAAPAAGHLLLDDDDAGVGKENGKGHEDAAAIVHNNNNNNNNNNETRSKKYDKSSKDEKKHVFIESNAHQLKRSIETGEYVPDEHLATKLQKKIAEKEEEKERKKREKYEKKKREKMSLMQIEIRIRTLINNIKENLIVGVQDIDKCLEAMNEVDSMSISPLLLKKNPDLVITIRKCRKFKSSGVIRQKADYLHNKFKAMFMTGDIESFNKLFEAVSQTASTATTTADKKSKNSNSAAQDIIIKDGCDAISEKQSQDRSKENPTKKQTKSKEDQTAKKVKGQQQQQQHRETSMENGVTKT